jgi:hypothetical protein
MIFFLSRISVHVGFSLALAFFCATGIATGQSDFRLEWGPVLKAPDNSGLQKVFHVTDQGFSALRIKGASDFSRAKLFVEQYDASFQLRQSTPFKLRYKGKDLQYVDLLSLGGTSYLLTSYFNKSHKKNYLFAQEFTERQTGLSPRLRMIAELPSYNMFQEGSFGIHTSEDTSFILIHASIPEKKNDPERFAFFVYDNTMERIWSKTVRLPYPSGQYDVEDIQIDQAGNVYVLGLVYDGGKKSGRRGQPGSKYLITAYRAQGEEKKEYWIGLDDRFITDLTFKVNPSGQLICAGFYSDLGTNSVKGTYYMVIDGSSQEVLRQGLEPFDIGFLTTHLSDSKQRKAIEASRAGQGTPELLQYSLNDLILRSDGGAVLIAEQYYVDEDRFYYNPYRWGNAFWNPYWNTGWGWPRSGWNRGMNTVEVDYFFNYNDIIVINIRPDGSIEWSSRIPKLQETVNDGGMYSSYARAIGSSSILFLYNDHPANANPQGSLQAFTGNRAMLMLSSVDRSGVVSHFPLRSDGSARVMARPKSSKQVGSRELLLYGEWGREYQFGRLVY